jgi:hypothetical protein
MSLIDRVLSQVNELVELNLLSEAEEVKGSDLGLDVRVGRLWVDSEFIAVRTRSKSTLEYYGGFEYIDRDFVKVIGDYTFYLAEDDRVYEAIMERPSDNPDSPCEMTLN